MNIEAVPAAWPEADRGASIVREIHRLGDDWAVATSEQTGHPQDLVLFTVDSATALVALSSDRLRTVRSVVLVRGDGSASRWPSDSVTLVSSAAFPGMTEVHLTGADVSTRTSIDTAALRDVARHHWNRLAAAALEMLADCASEAARYLANRPFGLGVLADQQVARFMVTESWSALEFLRLATTESDIGSDAASRTAFTRTFATAVEQCAQALGGRGYLTGSTSGATYEHLGTLTMLLRGRSER